MRILRHAKQKVGAVLRRHVHRVTPQRLLQCGESLPDLGRTHLDGALVHGLDQGHIRGIRGQEPMKMYGAHGGSFDEMLEGLIANRRKIRGKPDGRL